MIIRNLYDWMANKVYSPYANFMLGFLFYLEAIIFLPTDPMLIVYCLERRNKAFLYATIATGSSVLGGITGYSIGYILWETMGPAMINSTIMSYIFTPQTFKYLCNLYQQYEYGAILIAGFTPIPYKAATLTAGFCKLSFLPFVICSLISRGARFYLYAIVIKIWGKQMKQYIDRYFNLLLILAMVFIAFTLWFLKR